MLFEILKNSLRAVVETHGVDCEDYPPVKVIVAEGNEDITIKISDQGGGIPRTAVPLVWTFMCVPLLPFLVLEVWSRVLMRRVGWVGTRPRVRRTSIRTCTRWTFARRWPDSATDCVVPPCSSELPIAPADVSFLLVSYRSSLVSSLPPSKLIARR